MKRVLPLLFLFVLLLTGCEEAVVPAASYDLDEIPPTPASPM